MSKMRKVLVKFLVIDIRFNELRVSLRRLCSDVITKILTPLLVSSDDVAINLDAVSRHCLAPVRSSLLERDPLPEFKDAYNVMSRKESHRGVLESFGVTETRMNASSFTAKCFNNGYNANVDVKQNEKVSSRNSSPVFTFEQMKKLLSLINETPSDSIHANMVGKTSFFNGNVWFNIIFSNHVGNLKLTNNVTLYDVLVVPGYYKREKVLGTVSETSGHYMFNMNDKCYVGKLNVVMSFHVFKLLWHKRLGHPAKIDFSISKDTSVPIVPSIEGFKYILTIVDDILRLYGSEKCVLIAYSTIKKAYKLLSMDSQNAFYSRDVRFYKNIFPFKQKTCDITDVENTSKVDHLRFFDSQKLQSPNDDAKDTSVVDGSLQPSTDTGFSTSLVDVQKPGIRTSSRQSKLPVKLNDYVLSYNVKYGIDKYFNYSKLKGDILCFATTLNKSVKPSCLKDALFDPNWVEDMNNKIEALNRNNTWTECDLPLGRKPIGSKWI
nr:hypothetical protein [Tanacetum cinerariifolium]